MKELTYEEAEHIKHLKDQVMEFRHKLDSKKREERIVLRLFDIERILTDIYYGTLEEGGCNYCA